MTPTETTTILRQFNDWRRGGDIDQPGPLAVGEAIDAAVEMIERLEAAEKAVAEAYQLGYETGQEEIAAELEFAKREVANLHDDISEWMDKCDALRAKMSDLTIGMEYLSNLNNSYKELIGELQDERDALRAKVAEMEQQRPFAWIVRGGYPVPLENLEWQLLCGAERPTLSWTNQEMRPLYALPGAQPAPSVPEVTDAMALAFHHALTDGSIGAREVEEIKDALRAALAAAPEAKP